MLKYNQYIKYIFILFTSLLVYGYIYIFTNYNSLFNFYVLGVFLLLSILLYINTKDNSISVINRNITDSIRVIGTILVVVGHSTFKILGHFYPENINNIGVSKLDTIMNLIVGIIYSFHMPLFFFLSGIVFFAYSSGKQEFTMDNLIKNKVKALIIPFLFIGVCFALPIKYSVGVYGDKTFFQLVKEFLLFKNDPFGIIFGHLWFLGDLFWCFIIFYSINNLFKKIPDYIKITIIVIFNIYYSNFGISLPGMGALLPKYYLIIFSTGYFYAKYSLILSTNKQLLYITLILSISYFIQEPIVQQLTLILLKIFTTIYIIMLINKFFTLSNKQLYQTILRYSFAIYIIHEPLQLIILHLYNQFGNSGINVELFYVTYYFSRIFLTIIICIFLTKLWHLLPLTRRIHEVWKEIKN